MKLNLNDTPPIHPSMKSKSNHRSALPLSAYIVFCCCFLASSLASADEIISAQKISEQVINAPLTRAWPKTRRGFTFVNSRSFASSESRSLAMVEESVKVDGEARISLPITFELNSSESMTGKSAEQLKALLTALKDAPSSTSFLIEGHTCVIGDPQSNNRLSIARANFVIDYLVKHGVPTAALRAIGCGSSEATKAKVKKTPPKPFSLPTEKS